MSELQEEHWWYVARRQYIASILKSISPNSLQSVLEVGCGPGPMIGFLRKYGKTVIGIEYSKYALRLCHNHGNDKLVRGTIEKLPFPDESFDLVTAFEVLYHRNVRDDMEAIKELYRICKKGGNVLIVDPAFHFLKGQHHDFSHGMRRYTVKTLSQKLESAGFFIKKASYLYMCIFPLLCMIRLFKNMFFHTGAISSELKKTNRVVNQCLIFLFKEESCILRSLNLPFGASVLCVAEKRPV